MGGDVFVRGVFVLMLVVGIAAAVVAWYLAIFVFALLIFLIVWVIARSATRGAENTMVYRPGTEIPAAVWELAEKASLTVGPSSFEVDLVELDKYRDNWERFRETAQVERPGEITLNVPLLCYRTPTGDHGIVLAHDRLVLGEVRRLERDIYFDSLWKTGGVALVGCRFTFGRDLLPERAQFEMSVYNNYSREHAPETGAWAAWKYIWGGLRGK